MKSSRFIDRRVGYGLASISLLIGMVVPSVFPAFVSADQLDTRSIQMSSASASATGVKYKVTFTPKTDFRKLVIDFCSDSPIPGEACSTTDDAVLSGASVGTAVDAGSTGDLGTLTGTPSTNGIAISGTTNDTAGDDISITISGVVNPDVVGSFYARIYTYAASPTTPYSSPTSLGDYLDSGGIALSTTADIGVSAAVRETLTFCVAKIALTPACANAVGNEPSITLGHNSGSGELALDSSATDTANVYTQVSSNAASGVAVWMKSGNQCGGLHRFGAASTTCDIAAVGSTDPSGSTTNSIAFGAAALFGMKLGTDGAASGATNPLGTIVPATDYSTGSNYGMDYKSDNSMGVTSAYGSEIYNTDGPSNDWNVPMTFAATVTNATPAGKYSQSLSLIATGTY